MEIFNRKKYTFFVIILLIMYNAVKEKKQGK
jgi:hypothetical protein